MECLVIKENVSLHDNGINDAIFVSQDSTVDVGKTREQDAPIVIDYIC